MFEPSGLCQTLIYAYLFTSIRFRLAHSAREESSPEILENMQEMRFVISPICGFSGVQMREGGVASFVTIRPIDTFVFFIQIVFLAQIGKFTCVCVCVCVRVCLRQLQWAKQEELEHPSGFCILTQSFNS